MEVYFHDIGNKVVCDICDADYTASHDSGGYLFGSYAVCPKCEPKHFEGVVKYAEERYIKSRCPKNKSFADWVRNDLRVEQYRALFD